MIVVKKDARVVQIVYMWGGGDYQHYGEKWDYRSIQDMQID